MANPDHPITSISQPSGHAWQSTCACGWTSPGVADRLAAAREGVAHIAAVVPGATATDLDAWLLTALQ